MEKQFVPYELAVKLKEFGFDEPCFAKYVEDEKEIHGQFFPIKSLKIYYTKYNRSCVKAPLWQQAFDWFTSKGYHSYIEGAYPWFRYYINTDDDRYEGFKHLKLEEARQACLEKLIELVK